MLVPVTMAGDPDTASDRVEPLQAVTAAGPDRLPAAAGRGGRRRLARQGPQRTLGGDLHQAELISLPLTLVILLVAFGALIAAGVPLLLALSSVAAAIGLSAFASHLVPGEDAHHQRHPAHRHGGRRRLLAVLRPARARGTREGRQPARGDRDRRRDLRATPSSSPASPSVIAMAGMFVARDATFSSLGVGVDPGRARRRPRLADRAAGAAVQARPLGRPARGSRSCGASPAARTGKPRVCGRPCSGPSLRTPWRHSGRRQRSPCSRWPSPPSA